jgi:dihydrofolate reductase
VELVVAHNEKFVIGFQNDIPWNLKQDRNRFKNLTTGRTIVMGRKTYESIGHPLPARKNIVVSRTMKPFLGVSVLPDISLVPIRDDIMIIGGGEIYKYFFKYIKKMYVTLVFGNFPGDVYFPKYDLRDWKISDEEITTYYKFMTLERK